jgi:tRNA-modifying protein YgfZ
VAAQCRRIADDVVMEQETTLFADRSDRAKLRVHGGKRLWFLHQQLTQAFEDMTPGSARDAAMITVHGRMRGFLETVATENEVLCHFEPELRPGLIEELSRFAPLIPVGVEDITDDWGLILVAGPAWNEGARLCPHAIVHETGSLGVPAVYLWMPAESTARALSDLAAQGFELAAEERLEALRIKEGVPRWGREMDFKTFPQEVGVDERAVHYDKGCYLGQEAMAKIHFRGKVNRRLARLGGAQSLTARADVILEGKRIGTVTSASNGRALALVRAEVQPGTEVMVGGSAATVDPAEED